MKGAFVFAIGVALALASFGTALAQDGGACQLTDGVAVIASGVLDEDPEPESGAFGFTGKLAGPIGSCEGKMVCSVGTLENATCVANQHSGSVKICDSCSLDCGGVACDSSNITASATIICNGQRSQGSFQGFCAGANCSGGGFGPGNRGLAYSLLFDAATVQTALAVCDDPTAVDDSIDEAGFGGALLWGRQ